MLNNEDVRQAIMLQNAADKRRLKEEKRRIREENLRIQADEQEYFDELSKYAEEKRYKTEYSLNMLEKAIEIEHEAGQTNLLRYRQDNTKITKLSRDEYRFLYTKTNIPPNAFQDIFICLTETSSGRAIRGTIQRYELSTSFVFFATSSNLDCSKTYSIKYEADRFLTDSYLEAIQRIRDYELTKYFTTFKDGTIALKKKRNIRKPKQWFNQKLARDAMQMKAVEDIITEVAYPYPYVVIGGPGTGKTTVIVEAILQILDKKSFANILVTCQSNSACDEVGVRLRNFISSVKVFRYFARKKTTTVSNNKDNYFERLRENSTITERGTFIRPPIETLLKYKVVIATMTMTRPLLNRGMKNNHFDFIFIDECCAAIEPECLSPILAFGMDRKKVNGNIILVGDDKLLGPVLKDPLAKGLGLEQSLLERILLNENYSSDSKRIVKLNNNYRSHPELFRYSNETFYNSSMISMISNDEYNLAVQWKQLPNPDIPMIFDSVESESVEVKDIEGSSLYNLAEVEQVAEYVKHLLSFEFSSTRKIKQDEIGIATPYIAQVKRLVDRMKDLPKIDIGTTEFFQSREKPIMIISAVRTKSVESIEFLDNPRRLNVLLTRAKSLMIIVGNLEKLQKFPSWEPFIEMCVRSRVARRGQLYEEVEGEEVLMDRIAFLRLNSDDESSDENETENSSG